MKRKKAIWLIIAYLGTMLGLYGVSVLQYVLMSLPLPARMISMIAIYWLIAIIPSIVMFISKDSLSDYGFRKEKLGLQILIGVVLGVVMSVLLTMLPHLAGFGMYVDNGKRYHYFWQFAYEFVYCILAVGAVEEFVFRGCIYTRVKHLFGQEWVAVIVSSALFGIFHVLSGNVVQMIVTAMIGAVFCLFRLKMKNISTLSLIITHGVYNALISVWAFLFV